MVTLTSAYMLDGRHNKNPTTMTVMTAFTTQRLNENGFWFEM